MNFINASEDDQIVPGLQDETAENTSPEESSVDEQNANENSRETQEEENPHRKAFDEKEAKALCHGQNILESLFPKAGWERMSLYPDFYPYFRNIFDFPKGYELVSPTDPMQQIIVLMWILEELFFGLRYVSFGVSSGPEGAVERLDEIVGKIMNEWPGYRENMFDKLYVSRLSEYCRILDSSQDDISSHSQRVLNEMYLLKKFCFLPYYKFTPLSPATINKRSVNAIYADVRTLRRCLTIVAINIEQANKKGGAAAYVTCDGIDNPWDPYNFQVPNPVSTRIDALLAGKGPGQKNNASLIFFTLSVTVVLDHLMNNDRSWAYKEQAGSLFRSVDGEGQVPLMGVDAVIDADSIFKQSIKQRERKDSQVQQD